MRNDVMMLRILYANLSVPFFKFVVMPVDYVTLFANLFSSTVESIWAKFYKRLSGPSNPAVLISPSLNS